MTDEVVTTKRPSVQPVEVWLGVLAVYTGLAFFFPDALPRTGTARPIEAAFPGLVNLWSALYAAGGVGIVVGLLRRSPHIEGAGLNLLGSGLTVSLLATMALDVPLLPSLLVQGGAIAACVYRLWELFRTKR